MMHLSLTTGGPAAWEGKVSDEEYGGPRFLRFLLRFS